MNILDAEEMVFAEQVLLQMETHPPYTFAAPDPSLLSLLHSFSSTLFLPASRPIQEQAQRLVANAHSIKTVRKEDPNACLKAFAYSVFYLIFPPADASSTQKPRVNDSLLETLKCSLFSRDLNFSHVSNSNLAVDTPQAKAMLAKFFHSILARKQYSNTDKIRYFEWSLEKNKVLLELFILFYRIILTKLYVEGAEDYNCHLNFSEAITNLIEYFDISYRSFGELFLISEENYFLASVNANFTMGAYLENDRNRDKASTKAINGKEVSQIIGGQKDRESSGKKNGVFENDIKIFNFILESGRESHIINEKDVDIQTPHFKDSHEFAFGRRRKDEELMQRQEELKKEFEKFLMNSSAESVEEVEHERKGSYNVESQKISNQPISKAVQQEREDKSHNIVSKGNVPQVETTFLRKSTFNDSLIHQLEDEISDQPKNNPETHHRNIVLVKDKNLTTFSPQINNHQFEGFSSYVNDAMFLDQEGSPDLFKSSSGGNAQNTFPYCNECACAQMKKKRNKIVSKVIDVTCKLEKQLRSPKFIQNLKFSQNLNTNSPKIKAAPKENLNLKPQMSYKQMRKPSFLKFLKKEKEGDKSSLSSKSKSKSNKKSINAYQQAREKYGRSDLDKATLDKIYEKCTAFSTILSKNQLEPKLLSSKSNTNRNENSLNKKQSFEQPILKNFDSKYLNFRPGLGSNWKQSHHSPLHFQKQKPIEGGQIQTSRNQKVRVYAPVNIIAPTLYFNGNTERDNRVVFTVNDYGGDKSKGLKMSERYMRTEPPVYLQERVLGTPQHRYI